jgi:hypothetical protein
MKRNGNKWYYNNKENKTKETHITSEKLTENWIPGLFNQYMQKGREREEKSTRRRNILHPCNRTRGQQ